MRKYKDRNDELLKDGDVINIYQTVNGRNLFVVLDVEKILNRMGLV